MHIIKEFIFAAASSNRLKFPCEMSTNLPSTANQLPNQKYNMYPSTCTPIVPSPKRKKKKNLSTLINSFTAMSNEEAIAPASSSCRSRATPSTFVSKLRSMLSSHSDGKRKAKNPATPSCTPTRSKSKRFGRVFHYFDENGDGKISPNELRNCINISGEEMSLEEIQAVVQSVDSDGDGLLGYDDFVVLMDHKDEEDKRRSLKEAFGAYEMEGEGCITAKSLSKALRLLGDSRSIEECKTMIRRFDLNGDGVLSFEEFENMMMNY